MYGGTNGRLKILGNEISSYPESAKSEISDRLYTWTEVQIWPCRNYLAWMAMHNQGNEPKKCNGKLKRIEVSV